MDKGPETTGGIAGKPGQPTLIDGSVTQWWGFKYKARQGAAAIGWPMNSVWPVMTRFQYGYALHQTHGGFLTRDGYARLLADRTGASRG